MRRALEELLRETTLLTLAAAIAIGWSAVELAQSISGAIVGFIQESQIPDDSALEELDLFDRTLTITVGDHALMLAPVLARLLAFLLVLAAVLLVLRRRPAA